MFTRCVRNALSCLDFERCGRVTCSGASCCGGTAWLFCNISGLLLLQHGEGRQEVEERETCDDEQTAPHIRETEGLVEDPDCDGLEPGGRECQTDKPTLTREGRHRHEQAREIHGRNDREDDAREDRRDLRPGESRDELA